MKLYFLSKTFSAKGKCYVYDENGELRYNIAGHSFWYSDYSVLDTGGNELIRVCDKVWSWRNRVRIIVNGIQTAEIVERISWRKKMDIKELGWYIEASNAFGKEYSISKDGQELAHINNHVWSVNDKMEVEIFDSAQELNVIGVILAIVISNQKAAAAAT